MFKYWCHLIPILGYVDMTKDEFLWHKTRFELHNNLYMSDKDGLPQNNGSITINPHKLVSAIPNNQHKNGNKSTLKISTTREKVNLPELCLSTKISMLSVLPKDQSVKSVTYKCRKASFYVTIQMVNETMKKLKTYHNFWKGSVNLLERTIGVSHMAY